MMLVTFHNVTCLSTSEKKAHRFAYKVEMCCAREFSTRGTEKLDLVMWRFRIRNRQCVKASETFHLKGCSCLLFLACITTASSGCMSYFPKSIA